MICFGTNRKEAMLNKFGNHDLSGNEDGEDDVGGNDEIMDQMEEDD
ncbi:hypothetical protein OROGR_010658 [Orobanche gracilis]